ncbi:MAG: biopolymer transporter ExbD [Victivallales bacterium]|nr:biopolymer transporter ExbD [Victivallales bacterium]
MARRKRVRSQLNAIDQINMTPLLDLTFLLLIIFMITAPLLEYAINVSPPEINADSLPDEDNRYVSLNSAGQIVYNKVIVSEDELRNDLQHLSRQGKKVNIMVRADRVRPYGEVTDLLKIVKESGFPDVFLVTQGEGK